MPSKALTRLEPLKAIAIWDLPRSRRRRREALEGASDAALQSLLRHDLRLIAILAGIFVSFASLFVVTGTLTALMPAIGLILAVLARRNLSQRALKASNYVELTPSPRLSLEAGLEQDLIDSAFRLNDDVFAWNRAAELAGAEEIDDRFRHGLIVRRERIAERLAVFEAMLGRYTLALDTKPETSLPASSPKPGFDPEALSMTK